MRITHFITPLVSVAKILSPKRRIRLPLLASWREKAALLSLSPLSSTQTLFLGAVDKNNLKQVTAELFFLMPFASGTRQSSQTLELLWADIRPFSLWQSQNILFNWISEMLMNIRGLTGCIFYLCLIGSGLPRRGEKSEGKSPTFSPALARQGWEARLVKIHPANAIGLMLVGLKPAEPQNCKPSQSTAS